MRIEKVAIVGMGAIGILLGDYFVRALGREAVRFIADAERLERYQRDGVYCNGQACNFRYSDGTDGVVDLLIFAVKTTGLEEAIRVAEPCVGADTTILSAMNGVTSEELIGALLGEEKVLYAVAQGMDASREGNCVTYQMPGRLYIGIPEEEAEKQPRLDAVQDFLERVGFPYSIEDDIQHRMWSKLMVNVGVNQVCMVFETDYGGVQKPGAARDTMLAAMNETRKIAACRGVLLTQKDMEEYVTMVDSMTPQGMPSMRQDGLANRETEVEAFSGVILKLSDQYGMQVPVNRMLYNRIREMESEL